MLAAEAAAAGSSASSTTERTAARPVRGRPPKAPAKGFDPAQLRDELARDFTRLGSYLSIARPLTGMVIVNRAERAADALSLLAAQNPRIARMLMAVAGAGVYAEVGFIVGDVLVALAVEQQAIPMDHPLAKSIQPEIAIMVQVVEREQERARQRAAAEGVTLE